MTNSLELKAAIVRNGYTQEEIAEMLGITVATLNYKINNKSEFKGSEIKKLAETLSLSREQTDNIFFAG